jgi:hypothetical protein
MNSQNTRLFSGVRMRAIVRMTLLKNQISDSSILWFVALQVRPTRHFQNVAPLDFSPAQLFLSFWRIPDD